MSDVSQRDLTALTERELGIKLNEIDHDRSELTTEAIECEKALAKASVTLIYDPKNQAAKAERITQRAALKAIGHRLRDLRESQSAIQSIIKLQGTTGGI